MFNIKQSKFTKPLMRSDQSQSPQRNAELGATKRHRADRGSTADLPQVSLSGITTNMPNTSIGNMPVTIDTDPMLVGLMPNNYKILYALYRDIYYNDPVGGSAVDLLSSLPFGDFSLGGIESPKIMQSFQENIERLSTKTLIPEMSVDYLVLGMHCHSMLYNQSKKLFVDVMPYAPENVQVVDLPFYSQDPLLTATFSDNYRAVLSEDSPRMRRLRALIGNDVFSKIQQGSLELDPLTTVYIPRKTFSDTDIGVSYYRRLLPIYLIEKNLYRGTLVESARRQRGITHLTLGDGDNWIPSPSDMDSMVDLFTNADTDPIGAIIATRAGVSVEEIRQCGDFWKVTDFTDSVLPQKLRALSISEAFLSGDANYNVNDSSMTVFVDMMLSFRSMMTRKFFYEKLFPLVSMVNGYTVDSRGRVVIKESMLESMAPEEALYTFNDGSKLLIPKVEWATQLKPESDSSYMETLQTLTDKGVPVPIRTLAAAGGLNLDDLLKQQDEDLALRKKLNEYRDRLKELEPSDDSGDDEESTAEASSIISKMHKLHSDRRMRSSVQARFGKVPLFSRDFGEAAELHDSTATGKKTHIIGQKAANERINRRIVRAMSSTLSKNKR